MVRLRLCCGVRDGSAVLAVLLALAVLPACSGGAGAGTTPRDAGPAAPHVSDGATAAVDEAVDAGPPPRLYAKRFVVNVRVAPDNESFRQGYLRGGAIVRAKNSVPLERGKPGCLAGFWELETGGYVCNVRDVMAFHGRRPPERPPSPADREAVLPYEYGINRRNNTAMYRRLPTDEEAAEFEGYRIPGSEPPDGGVVAEGTPSGASPGAEPTANPAAPENTPPVAGASELAATNAAAMQELAAVNAPLEPVDAGGPPTLASLRGEEDSALLRRLVKGFYISLDRDVRVRQRRYWRTLSNGYVPYDRLSTVRWPSFRGKVLDGTTVTLPAVYVVVERAYTYRKTDDGRLRRVGQAAFHDFLGATVTEEIRGKEYVAIAGDLYIERRDVRYVTPTTELPPGLAAGEKWIDVDLAQQTLVAYEGDRPVYVTLVSTGRIMIVDDPELDRRTPPGDYRITSKHVATTMDGDSAVDGPYSIEDVPYVMYFQLAYALHSAFWHNRFGRTKSHGCVNLAPLDAKWVFEWSLPHVPLSWHGAYPSPQTPGTRLVIHGDTPEG